MRIRADVKDIKSALFYALRLEIAALSSRRDRHTVRDAIAKDERNSQAELLKSIEKIFHDLEMLKTEKQSRKKTRVKCWGFDCTAPPEEQSSKTNRPGCEGTKIATLRT